MHELEHRNNDTIRGWNVPFKSTTTTTNSNTSSAMHSEGQDMDEESVVNIANNKPPHDGGPVQLQGHILSTRRVASGKVLELHIHSNNNKNDGQQNDNGAKKTTNNDTTKTIVQLDSEKNSQLTPWMIIRGAHKLLCAGVLVRVDGIQRLCIGYDLNHHDNNGDDVSDDADYNTNNVVIEATRIMIDGVLPSTPYLARFLSFPIETFALLFPRETENNNNNTKHHESIWIDLACAFRPVSVSQVQALFHQCDVERKAGRYDIFFKHPQLLAVCDKIRRTQNWSKSPSKIPSTSAQTWSALLRMEELWCRDCRTKEDTNNNNDKNISTMNEKSKNDSSTTSAPLIISKTSIEIANGTPTTIQNIQFNGVNVDPSLNLPDPTDQRRLQYVNERKRPQVLWMLNLIQRLVHHETTQISNLDTNNNDEDDDNNTKSTPIVLRFVDIGGGRGDLANAVAAYYSSSCALENDTSATDTTTVGSPPPPPLQVHVVVLDVNQSSLDAGKARAMEANNNLAYYMSFCLCDLSNPDQVAAFRKQYEPIDLVFGLHCCGGVAEAAVELALQCNASFAVSTCCFRSHQHLASLSRLAAESMVRTDRKEPKHDDDDDDPDNDGSGGNDEVADDNDNKANHHHLQQQQLQLHAQHELDQDLVRTLALIGGAQGQHRAIRAINAMRLSALEERFNTTTKSLELHDDDCTGSIITSSRRRRHHPRALRTWLEFFPVEYSQQNCVMVGTMERGSKNQ